MTTKLVYAVTSDSSDIFLEQTLVSIYSAKYWNPKATIVLVVDQETQKSLIGKRASILNWVNEYIVVNVPDKYSKKESSRYVKTILRSTVHGTYLFIDGDTVITEPLDAIDDMAGDICMVKDLHVDFANHPVKNWVEKQLRQINCPVPNIYFNSGVIYAKDTPAVHKLYSTWHSLYIQGLKQGVTQDQPSLEMANYTCGNLIRELNGVWNCQIRRNGIRFLSNAKIIHYFNSNRDNLNYESNYILSEENIYLEIQETGSISDSTKKLIIDAKHAFPVQSMLFVGKQLMFSSTTIYNVFAKLYQTHCGLFSVLNYFLKVIISPIKLYYFLKKK